ncbi:MAG: HEAT repeat domain-containing protein, partial [Myxococcota bacterium]
RVRIATARALGRLGDPRAVVPLIGRARDSADVRTAVFAALGELGDARAAPALVQGMRDEEPQVRLVAIASLGRLGQARTIAPLSEVALDTDVRIAHGAVQALAGIEGPDVETVLLDLLGRPQLSAAVAGVLSDRESPTLTTRLADALRTSTAARAVPIVNVLAVRLEHAPEAIADVLLTQLDRGGVTVPLLRSLALVGGEDALIRLLALLPEHTAEALTALEIYFERFPPESRAADPVLELLSSRNAAIRGRAVELLGRLGAPRSVPALVRLSNHEPMARASLRALASIARSAPIEGGDAQTLRARLREALDGTNAEERFEASRGLEALVGTDDLDWIASSLEAPPPVDRHAYLRVLGGALLRTGDENRPRIERILRGFLQSDDAALADASLETLEGWTAPAALRLLQRVPAERQAAATIAIGRRADGEAIVLERLTHSDANVRIAAASVAERIDGALPLLTRMVQEGAWPEPAAASFALVRRAIREHDASLVPALCTATQRRDPIARANGLTGLRALGANCEGLDVRTWTRPPHALMVRRAAERLLAGNEGAPPRYTGRLDLFVHDAQGNRLRNGLTAVRLADSTVMLTIADGRGRVRYEGAPEGAVFAIDPLRLRLEP